MITDTYRAKYKWLVSRGWTLTQVGKEFEDTVYTYTMFNIHRNNIQRGLLMATDKDTGECFLYLHVAAPHASVLY